MRNFSVKSNANQVAAFNLTNFLLNQRKMNLQYSITSRNFSSNQMQMKLQDSFIQFREIFHQMHEVPGFDLTENSVKLNPGTSFHEFFCQIRCKSSYVFTRSITLWSSLNFCITWKLFREIEYIVNSLLKVQKFRKIHSVSIQFHEIFHQMKFLDLIWWNFPSNQMQCTKYKYVPTCMF